MISAGLLGDKDSVVCVRMVDVGNICDEEVVEDVHFLLYCE